LAQPPSQGAQGATGPVGRPTGTYGTGQARPAGSTPIGIGGSGASLPAPRIDPADAARIKAAAADGTFTDAADPHAEPADLNRSWRAVMTALGQGLPHGLNRAVASGRRLHRAVS
jgi:hypothetical protein